MTNGSVSPGEGEVLLDSDRVNLGDAADYVCSREWSISMVSLSTSM